LLGALLAIWLAENFVRTPGIFAGLLLSGITVGAVYALVALGYTLVYAIADSINFAHGDVFICGAMIAATLSRRLHVMAGEGGPTLGVKLLLMLGGAMALSAALSGAVERIAFRPLRRAPRLAPLVATVGLTFVIENALLIWQGNHFNAIEPVLPHGRILVLGGISYTWDKLIILGAVLLLLAGLDFLLRRTRHGKAMRAVSQDREAAALVGIDVNRTIFATFVTAGALAGGAGFLYLVYVTNVAWDQGFTLGIVALTAAILGGIGNPTGAVLGALVIGVTEALNEGLSWHAPGSDWTPTIVFSVLILLLVLRPTGLLGDRS
jgi:branched-chain amino acid transport system permease protein